MKKFLILFLCIFFMIGCSKGDSNFNSDGTIKYMYAKEIIINEGAVLIDVRTKDEYDEKHIDGAILIPLDDINEEVVKENVSTKDTSIIVYCRSGDRSSQAASILKSLGYSKVYDLGSIDNWKE
jgi:rhodanese-related sulfurtransferase